jgi:hypothetical protein
MEKGVRGQGWGELGEQHMALTLFPDKHNMEKEVLC